MITGLKNKVILITGASGGIGSALARAFAAEGARLVLHYRRRRVSAENLGRDLQGSEVALCQADLTREPDVKRLLSQARAAFGRVDSLVANAGIWVEKEVPLATMSLAQWRRTLDTDLTAVFLCCRALSRLVRKQQQGDMVIISSTAGVFGEGGHADYAAAKSALAFGMTRTLKNEISRLAPHTADTRWTSEQSDPPSDGQNTVVGTAHRTMQGRSPCAPAPATLLVYSHRGLHNNRTR